VLDEDWRQVIESKWTWRHSCPILINRWLREPYREGLKLDNPSAYSDRKCLGAIRRSQLFHEMLNVRLHREFADEKIFGNIAIALTVCDLRENLDLSFR
jgi:hypothetical protein